MRRVAALLLGLAGVAAAQSAAERVAAHWRARVARFTEENARLDATRRHVVLVGDSLTEGWERGERIARFLPALAPRVLDRGIGADGVGLNERGLLHRLDSSIFDARPGHVVLLIGVNDLGHDGSGVGPAARVYEQVLAAIRARAPDVVLIVVTLAPTRGDSAWLNPHVLRMNEQVRRLAASVEAPLLDLHPLLADEQGELAAAMAAPDGLHWADPAYELLGRALERLVAEHPARE